MTDAASRPAALCPSPPPRRPTLPRSRSAARSADRIRSVPSVYRCSTARRSARARLEPGTAGRRGPGRSGCPPGPGPRGAGRSLAVRRPSSPGSRRRCGRQRARSGPGLAGGVEEPSALGHRPSGSGTARSRPSSSAAESRSTSISAFRSAASRASTAASACSIASLRCWRQVSAAATASAVSCSRPRRSISAGVALRSSPSNSLSSCPVISRPSLGACRVGGVVEREQLPRRLAVGHDHSIAAVHGHLGQPRGELLDPPGRVARAHLGRPAGQPHLVEQ